MAERIKKEQKKEVSPLEKKLDQLIGLQEQQIELLQLLTNDRCTCKKHKKVKGEEGKVKREKGKEKSEKKLKKEKRDKS
jgi:hypothetical protein